MSVTTFATGDLFIFRTLKHLYTNPDNRWANSYEFQATMAGETAALAELAGILVLFEQAMMLDTVRMDRVLVSTWEADSVPYDPSSFISTSLTAVGTRVTSGELIGLNNTFSVARVSPSGRFGHIFYRGVLTEPDINAPAGKTVLQNKAGMQTLIEDALESSGLGEAIGTSGDSSLNMVLISKDGATTRVVLELIAQGVSSVPQDHAWFNRTTS